MHQEIIDYIGQAQKHGLTDFEIKQNLLSAGWEAPVWKKVLCLLKPRKASRKRLAPWTLRSGFRKISRQISPRP